MNNNTPSLEVSRTEQLGLLGDHLDEMRQTLLATLITIGCGMVAAFVFHREIFALLTTPLDGVRLVLLSPLEGLITTFKMCFWVGTAGTFFIWIQFILKFLTPALHERERKVAFPLFLMSCLFGAIGIVFSYFVTIPLANSYLKAFNTGLGENFWSLSSYMDYTLGLMLANLLAFEFGALFLVLIHYEIISEELLRSYRRVSYLVIFIASAILTPPDVITQLMMALPLLLMYEAGLFWAAKTKTL